MVAGGRRPRTVEIVGHQVEKGEVSNCGGEVDVLESPRGGGEGRGEYVIGVWEVLAGGGEEGDVGVTFGRRRGMFPVNFGSGISLMK